MFPARFVLAIYAASVLIGHLCTMQMPMHAGMQTPLQHMEMAMMQPSFMTPMHCGGCVVQPSGPPVCAGHCFIQDGAANADTALVHVQSSVSTAPSHALAFAAQERTFPNTQPDINPRSKTSVQTIVLQL